MLRDAFEIPGAAALFLCALFALRTSRFDLTRFSVVAGMGAIYLGIDEALDLHERLGAEAYDRGWPGPPVVNHYDDLLVMLVALAGAAVVAVFWREVVADRTFAALFGGGAALFAAAIVVDASLDPSRTASWWTEETLELAGGAAMAAAFWARWRAMRGRAQSGPGATSQAEKPEGSAGIVPDL